MVRRKISGQRGFEYYPTKSAEELEPVLMSLGAWGLKWAKDNLTADDYDVELLMLYLESSIDPANLPGNETLIRFDFTDLQENKKWWLVVLDDKVEVCVKDPGKEVDIYFVSTVRIMTDVWLGHDTYRRAIRENDLKIVGPTSLTRNVTSWLRHAKF